MNKESLQPMVVKHQGPYEVLIHEGSSYIIPPRRQVLLIVDYRTIHSISPNYDLIYEDLLRRDFRVACIPVSGGLSLELHIGALDLYGDREIQQFIECFPIPRQQD